ncbi:MAG: glycosyl hydrolase family 53 [Oscillospiraceae bacterium]|nr:glycosyl hydrolase family 53 [Oscillospiraceae bacterium]
MEIKGYTYGWDSRRGMFSDKRSLESMTRMSQLGTNWATLAFMTMQEKYSSTTFGFDFRFNSPDREIETAIDNLHKLGMKVCLKPILNCGDGTWRAHIHFPEREFPVREDRPSPPTYWQQWFSCYKAYMCHYAEIAEYMGCEMYCVGCEMLGTEMKEKEWREVIAAVRSVYSGKLVYNTNHGSEDRVRWFDALDYIGVSAYYRIPRRDNSTVDDMVKLWDEPKKTLKAVSEKFGKKIIFMEIGCRSARGCADMPWDFTHPELPRDEDEQAMFYESAMKAMWDEPYFEGFFWWDWNTFLCPEEKISTDTGFEIYGKKTETLLRKWYTERN